MLDKDADSLVLVVLSFFLFPSRTRCFQLSIFFRACDCVPFKNFVRDSSKYDDFKRNNSSLDVIVCFIVKNHRPFSGSNKKNLSTTKIVTWLLSEGEDVEAAA